MKILKINTKFFKYILFSVGLSMISYFIWVRFIRTRIPRDIPFTLTLYGFFILLYICCIYSYIIYRLITNKKSNSIFISALTSYIYKPLIIFDETIKTNKIIEPYYEKILVYFIFKLKQLVTLKEAHSYYYAYGHSYHYLYIIVHVLPRIILLTALLIDTFYFYQLFLLYKIVLIGLIIIISSYVKYSFTYAQEIYILKLENIVDKIQTDYYDPNDELGPECGSYLSVRDFVFIQVDKITKDLKGYTYNYMYHTKYLQEYKLINNLPMNLTLNSVERKDINKFPNKIMEILIPLSVHIEEYSYPSVLQRYQYVKALIFSLYLLCWSYILIISFHTLPENMFSFLYNVIDKEEPFSLLNLYYP